MEPDPIITHETHEEYKDSLNNVARGDVIAISLMELVRAVRQVGDSLHEVKLDLRAMRKTLEDLSDDSLRG